MDRREMPTQNGLGMYAGNKSAAKNHNVIVKLQFSDEENKQSEKARPENGWLNLILMLVSRTLAHFQCSPPFIFPMWHNQLIKRNYTQKRQARAVIASVA